MSLDDLAPVEVEAVSVEELALREAACSLSEDLRDSGAVDASTWTRAAWRRLLGERRGARPPPPLAPPRLCYQRADLSRDGASDRATVRHVSGRVLRLDVIETDRTGENAWCPMSWAELVTVREEPAGLGLGLVRSWATRRGDVASWGLRRRDPVWTLYAHDGEPLAVIEGGPEELPEAAATLAASASTAA